MVDFVKQPFYGKLGSHFIDTHISQKIAIEYFLSQVVFKGDLKRIIYSQDNMAFRKRVELVDTSEKEENISLTSLDLPFGCYYRTKGYEPTDRVGGYQSTTAITGFYDEETDSWLRWQSVTSEYEATLFFSRQDDLRVASQLLFWEKNPESPITLATVIQYRKHNFYLPVFITIKDIDEATQYKESDSLKQNRIFPIKIKMSIRSALLLMDSSQELLELKQSLPLKFQYGPQWDENEISYAVERVTLTWACEKFNLSYKAPEVAAPEASTVVTGVKSITACIPSRDGEESTLCPNAETMDIMRGYFTDSTMATLNYLRQNVAKSTTTSVWLDFQVKNADRQYFNKITIYVPGQDAVVVTDCKQKSVELTGLSPDSTYTLNIVVEATSGETSTVSLTVSTASDPNNEAPVEGKRFRKGNALVGQTF